MLPALPCQQRTPPSHSLLPATTAPSNGTVQPPLTRDRLIRLERWLQDAAAYQPTVTDETAESVRGTSDAILCTREEWQERLQKSPETVSLYLIDFGKYVLLPTTIMCRVQTLKLICCNMTYLPDSIGRLESLKHLNLSLNQLTSLPDTIGQLTNLSVLYLTGSRLTSLPDTFGQLASLTLLYLNSNQLTSMPETFGQLASLAELYLYDNRLTSLPDTFGHLASLTLLYLNSNRLTSMPETFGQLTRLTVLYLDRNQLTMLPETIGQLTNLTHLYLQYNQLTSLPDTIGQLRNLIYWNMDRQLYAIINWSRYPGMCAPQLPNAEFDL